MPITRLISRYPAITVQSIQVNGMKSPWFCQLYYRACDSTRDGSSVRGGCFYQFLDRGNDHVEQLCLRLLGLFERVELLLTPSGGRMAARTQVIQCL